MPTGKALGRLGEQMASEYLSRKGYKILATNYKVRGGELDLVAIKDETLVFCEVKTRNSEKTGLPVEAVTPEKQRKILHVAKCFLLREAPVYRGLRFDVIQVMPGRVPPICHMEDAFGEEH